ncbi:unnamed protein product [Nezara viridula]|uniref:Uncharacterized protein n=1 Tax=Nezara viridula TaxID=85310 RepID=A0A9P0MGG5_NEZVI|nr:unnamed protein product [Nezara viridula]
MVVEESRKEASSDEDEDKMVVEESRKEASSDEDEDKMVKDCAPTHKPRLTQQWMQKNIIIHLCLGLALRKP